MRRLVTRTTALLFATVAGLHVAWGRGSSIPFRSRADLADAVVGADEVPPPAACYAVAALLSAAAALVVDAPFGPPVLRRTGRRVVAIVLVVRGIFGLSGRTDRLVAGSVSPRFRRLDRRYFAPFCLLLSAGVSVAD